MNIDKVAYKAKMVEILKAFIEICDQYGLQYFCHGGTAIGIVRHEGMIPWDDDIDVLMPRPDYDKFIRIFADSPHSLYDLMVPGVEKNYYLPFVKMCDRNSTLLEFEHVPCVLGVFIDIFPLDGASPIRTDHAGDWLNFRHLANKLMLLPKPPIENIKWFFSRLFKLQLRTAFAELECSYNKKEKYQLIVKSLNDIMGRYPYKDASYVASYCSQFGAKAFWPKEWFSGYAIKKFEGLDVCIPLKYDHILTQVYGDYMTLPPKEKQVTHHNVAYIDLENRKTINEVRMTLLKNS